tara:strand:- start:16576 stop:17418 length:843 start_codon:yes stop_codon:yes gene_type:complete
MKKKVKKYYVGGAINMAAGIGQGIVGISQYRKGGRELAQADSLKAGMIRSEAARRRMAQQNTEAMAGMQAINRNMATATEALGRRGNRALIGGAASLQKASDKATADYLSNYGTASAAQSKALERADFGESYARVSEDRNLARQKREAGFKNIVGGAGKFVGGAVDAFATTKDKENVKGLSDLQIKIEKQKKDLAEGVNNIKSSEEGGKISKKIKKTPGKFSHKENPIDIVQKGDKIGEMTGGEYVFNPDQAKKLQSLSKKGSSPLHKFVNKMLNKSQFK